MAKKKKSIKRVVKKKKPTVSTMFKCPICASENAVQCSMYAALAERRRARQPAAYARPRAGTARRGSERSRALCAARHLRRRSTVRAVGPRADIGPRGPSFPPASASVLPVPDLSEPVDVFGEWIDALEKDARGVYE